MQQSSRERRRGFPLPQRVLERSLNEPQLEMLRTLERFGWELKFVRKPAFGDPIPVIFDGSRQHYAILEKDGSLNENPPFKIRPR